MLFWNRRAIKTKDPNFPFLVTCGVCRPTWMYYKLHCFTWGCP
jgi:hypothetical protein